MHRTLIAFLSTLVLSTLVAPIASAAQGRVPAGISPEIAKQLSQANPHEPLPFDVREHLYNETFGR